MPVILRGRSKTRLEIQWEGILPVSITLCSKEHREIPLYRFTLEDEDRLQLDLEQLDFSQLDPVHEVNLIAVADGQEDQVGGVSESLLIQKCHHPECGQWGHAREDGYCKHCGRRIRKQSYTAGFPKLETSNFSIILWNASEGRLWKKREIREEGSEVHSWGQYEDADREKDFVDIIEEKLEPERAQRFAKLYQLLQETDLLDKFWKPPLACFQEEQRRALWIYYPGLPKERKWRHISALSYITDNVDIITTRDIVQVGIQLCKIVAQIHAHGYLWASLKLSDLILCRNKNNISIYLCSRDIAWNTQPSKSLLDTCLIPWELFWEEPLEEGYEVTEVYIIAALLYLLKAKAPNLLGYNSVSYSYGLPTLKLFGPPEPNAVSDPVSHYFESILNQALLLHPADRGYRTIQEFKVSLESLMQMQPARLQESCILEIGEGLDEGTGRRQDDVGKNQDAIFTTTWTLEKKNFGMFVLCDGVSTSSIGSGDIASGVVVATFREWWEKQNEEKKESICKYAKSNFNLACQVLNEIVSEANRRLCREVGKLGVGELLPEARVMGSTVTAGLLYDGHLVFGWRGDSPIYRISPLGWECLNYADNDRNAKLWQNRSIEDCLIDSGHTLTSCVGAHFYKEERLEMHFGITRLYPNEYILICSDGIPDYIEAEAAYVHQDNYRMLRIASVLYEYEKDALLDANAMAAILISTVNRVGGGYDNLSAILIRALSETTQTRDSSYPRLKALSFNMQKSMQEAHGKTQLIKNLPHFEAPDEQQ